jgi:NADH:ubiquinone reductase (H+-translocating)
LPRFLELEGNTSFYNQEFSKDNPEVVKLPNSTGAMAIKKQKWVVVGGGFAGIQWIRAMNQNPDIDIVLVDHHNYHFFPPLLYQVSTAFIEPSNISYPFRRLFRKQSNVRFFMGSLLSVHPEASFIETDAGRLRYDGLILAMGTETNFYGLESVQKHGKSMKTIEEALELRNHLLLRLEQMVKHPSSDQALSNVNIVISGGGATGVELAGMLAELGKHVGRKEYPELKNLSHAVYLIDAGPRLLAGMSAQASAEAQRVLQGLGVQVLLNTSVIEAAHDRVWLSNGQEIHTETLIWAAGVIAKAVPGLPKGCFGPGRRLYTDPFHRVLPFTNVFAIGDQAMQIHEKNYPKGHPQVAQVAIQQGAHLAEWVKNTAKRKTTAPFQYKDKGSMAIISKYHAVADVKGQRFKGIFAWLLWLFVHIIPLVGFRNRVVLAFNWFWAFFTNNSTLRLIIQKKSTGA